MEEKNPNRSVIRKIIIEFKLSIESIDPQIGFLKKKSYVVVCHLQEEYLIEWHSKIESKGMEEMYSSITNESSYCNNIR